MRTATLPHRPLYKGAPPSHYDVRGQEMPRRLTLFNGAPPHTQTLFGGRGRHAAYLMVWYNGQ